MIKKAIKSIKIADHFNYWSAISYAVSPHKKQLSLRLFSYFTINPVGNTLFTNSITS